MYTAHRMRQYQQQAIASASPAQLIAKMYDIGISACHQGDRTKVRRVVTELMGCLNFEEGGEIAQRLQSIYEFCLNQTVDGDLNLVCELLSGLREAWKEGVMIRQAA